MLFLYKLLLQAFSLVVGTSAQSALHFLVFLLYSVHVIPMSVFCPDICGYISDNILSAHLSFRFS